MIEEIKKQMMMFSKDISHVKNQNSNCDDMSILMAIKEMIKESTRKYFETDDVELCESLKIELSRYYNLLYYYQAKINGLRRAYMLDDEIEQLPNIYTLEQLPQRFEIDEELLCELNVSEGLTMDQTMELLKWTVNNSRNNLIIACEKSSGIPGDIYGNESLDGYCGLSQFSTLYPLQQLGLEVTINNVGDVCGVRHAYGTVIIPIMLEDKIVKKRFLIDCTYRQFFTLPFNVTARYLDHAPSVGFFAVRDKEICSFAKNLLENGFVEASLENLQKYFKPFFYSCIAFEYIDEMNEKFNECNIMEILEKKQVEFDYTEEEFIKWGLNLDFSSQKNKHL